jgi:small subunit ribosomal protein S1
VLEEERREVRQRILDTLDGGSVVEGTISNIVDFGAFVDLDGIDGLIHISELSWSHVNHPSEILEIGQKVRVKVLDIDRDRQRISLGLKQTQADPWQQVLDAYEQGDVVEGRVTKVVTFGAFVEIVPGVEGLVHISELAAHHVENPREVVSHGEAVPVKIIEIDAERRRLSLSLKRVTEEDDVKPTIELEGVGAPAAAGTEPAGEPAPSLGLSDDVFGDSRAADEQEPAGDAGEEAEAEVEAELEAAEPETAGEPEPVGEAEEAAAPEPAAEAEEAAVPEPAAEAEEAAAPETADELQAAEPAVEGGEGEGDETPDGPEAAGNGSNGLGAAPAPAESEHA